MLDLYLEYAPDNLDNNMLLRNFAHLKLQKVKYVFVGVF